MTAKAEILQNQKLLIEDMDFSNRISGISLNLTKNLVDETSIADTFLQSIVLAPQANAGVEGFFDHATTDLIFSDLPDNLLTSFFMKNQTKAVVYSFLAFINDYSFNGQVGNTFNVTAGAVSSGKIFRGRSVFIGEMLTGSMDSAVVRYQDADAGYPLAVILHVKTITGTLDVTLKSSTNADGSGASTVKVFNQISAKGGYILTTEALNSNKYFFVTLSRSNSVELDVIISGG